METMTNGVMPVYDMADRDNGFGGDGIWVLFLLFLFIGGGFGFNGGNRQDSIADQFMQRDIFSTNQNVSTTSANTLASLQDCCCNTQKEILESRYTNQLGLQNLGQQAASCCCETNRNIDAVRAENYKNTCDITTALHAEGEQTRALINNLEMQSLRDKLDTQGRNLATAEFQLSQIQQTGAIISQLQPTPRPAYLTCSPFSNNNPYNPYGAYPYVSTNA